VAAGTLLAAAILMSFDLVLRKAVGAAVMAPSSHNTQPWRFRIANDTLDLLADPTRQLAVIDRDRRQLVQSCGCALFNARIAIRAMGYTDDVTVMLVDHDHPEHLASIRLGGAHATTDTDRMLMGAIGCRATNRRAFLARPIPTDDIAALANAAAQEGALFCRLWPEQKAALGALIEEADQRQLADPAFRDELAHWLAAPGSTRRDGIPFIEKEYGSSMPLALTRTMHSRTLAEAFGLLERSLLQGAPAVIVLGTQRDDAPSWFACGQALEAVLLHATARGLSAAFMNQVLEIPALRARVATIVPEVGYPQMVLRIGVPSEPIERRAPRRNLADVIEVVPPPN
jgi:nitroreductase